jgi:hypothetical protein
MKRLALLTFTLITAVGASAMADDAAEAKSKALAKIAEYDNNVLEYLKREGLEGASRFGADPAGCTAAIAEAEKLGAAKTDTVNSMESFPFRKAAEHCERYAKLKTLTAAFPAIIEARQDANHLDGAAGGEGTTRFAGFAVDSGTKCVKALDEAEKNGAAMDVIIKYATDKDLTGAEVRTWCADMIKRAAALQGESASADAANATKTRERYTKFGAAGDKLEWLLRVDPRGEGKYWALSPRCERTDDAKKQVKAKVLIQWYDNADGTFTIHKLTFKGNKLVKEQTRSFEKRSQAQAFCK